jgi:L-threonylcarbamoyladenylate synthase
MKRAQILSPTPENIQFAAKSILEGNVGGMPTETVYGLAGDGLNPRALAKIFDTKARPTFDPLILHISLEFLGELSLSALRDRGLVDDAKINKPDRTLLEALMTALWPGPLTLVLPKLPEVPDLATSGLMSVALRMPQHPVARQLINETARPLAAPSANRFGRISPTRARHVIEELGERIDWVLDGGPCKIGVESTIVGYHSGDFSLLRPGGLDVQEIEKIIKMPLSLAHKSAPGEAVPAPGNLDSHYAPSKPLSLLPKSLAELSDLELEVLFQKAGNVSAFGILTLSGDPQKISTRLARIAGRPVVVRTLSQNGSIIEAAYLLFAELRALDASSAEALFAEPVPTTEGLGHAIQDRLKRASSGK